MSMMSPKPMLALTVRQPWAELIVSGTKDIENRTWPIPLKHMGKRCLIHAARTPDLTGARRALKAMRREWMFDELAEGISTDRIITGHVVGIVTLAGCVRDSTSPWAMPDHFHWQLTGSMRIESIRAKGFQGFWTLTI